MDQIHFALRLGTLTLSVLNRAVILYQVEKREVSLLLTFISLLELPEKLNVEARLDAFFLYLKKSLESVISPH